MNYLSLSDSTARILIVGLVLIALFAINQEATIKIVASILHYFG